MKISFRRRLFSLVVTVAVVVGISGVFITPAAAEVEQEFSPPAFSAQDNGAIALIGNSQMSCQYGAVYCLAARQKRSSTDMLNNDYWPMRFLDVDWDSTTSNSTFATLDMPENATVLYALLVWGGRTDAGDYGDPAEGPTDQVLFRTPHSDSYETVEAFGTNSSFYQYEDGNGRPYQATVDVTEKVKAAGNGEYYVGNINAGTGHTGFAGWSLVVAYHSPAAPMRDLRIYRGYAEVADRDRVKINIDGFKTPLTGPVNAAIGIVTWEGDAGIAGDGATLNGKPLSDAFRPASNFFNSSISDGGANNLNRGPRYPNNFGADIGRINTTNFLANGAKSAEIILNTAGDAYYPGLITTQIDLYSPAFNPTSKTVTNLSGHNPAQPGDTLRYQITFTNTGLDPADNPEIVDELPNNVSYVPRSLNVKTNTGGHTGILTDTADSDIGEYDAAMRTVKVRPGSGTPRSIAPDATATVFFDVTVDRPAAGTSINNTADLKYIAHSLGTPFQFTSNQVSTPVGVLADLSLHKTGPAQARAGEQISYQVTVRNGGPNAAVNPVVTDTLANNVSFLTAATPAGWACAATGKTVTCRAATLAVGAEAVLTLTNQIAPAAPVGMLVNSAAVTSETADDMPSNNTDTASTQLLRRADVSIAKTASGSATAGGDAITYTLTASNAGPSTAEKTTIIDVLPDGVSYVGQPPAGCTVDGQRMDCTTGTLAPHGTATVTISARVSAETPAGTVTNIGQISTGTYDPDGTNNSTKADTPVTTTAALEVNKKASAETAYPGDTVDWTIQLANKGPSNAAKVNMTDIIPAGLTLRSVAATHGTCTQKSPVTCTIAALSAGQTATVTVHTEVSQTTAGTLSNSTSAAGANADKVTANADVTVVPKADLALTKTGSADAVTWGSPFGYTLKVSNRGPSDAQDVTISDPLPAGMTFASGEGCTAAEPDLTEVRCTVGTLPAGADKTIELTVNTSADGHGAVTNSATVTSSTFDPETEHNEATAVTDGAAKANLQVTKSVKETSTTPLAPGSTATFNIAVANHGPSNAGAVTITDPLPEGLIFDNGPGCRADGRLVTCTVESLNVDNSVDVPVTVRIADTFAGGPLTNTSSATSAVQDPDKDDNSSSATIAVRPQADMQTTITAPTDPIMAGGPTQNWAVTVHNAGPAKTPHTTLVSIPESPDLTIGTITGPEGMTCTGYGTGSITCDLGDLSSGETATLTVPTTAVASSTATSLALRAEAGSTVYDPDPANNVASATASIKRAATMSLVKSIAPDPLVVGMHGMYTLTATNNGPSQVRSVIVSDGIPAGITPISATGSRSTCTTEAATNRITCEVEHLLPGESDVVTIEVDVTSEVGAAAANTATVDTDITEPTASNSLATTVSRAASLTVSKTATKEVAAGQGIAYAVTVTNSGPSPAETPHLTDTLPDGLVILPTSIQASKGNCDASTGSVLTCDLPTMANGEDITVTFRALVPDTAPIGTVVNKAEVTSTTPPAGTETRNASASTTITRSADIRVSKLPVMVPPQAGIDQEYVITVTNDGPSSANDVIVEDPISRVAKPYLAESSLGECTVKEQVECRVGTLAAGASATIQVAAHVSPSAQGQQLTNTATASSDTPDPNGDNNVGSVSQSISSQVNLELVKKAQAGPVYAGSTATYALEVTNTGPSDALNLTVYDPTPPGLTVESMTASHDGSCLPAVPASGGSPAVPPRCIWPTVPLNDTRTITLVANVDASIPAGTTLMNTATAGSDDSNPTPARANAIITVQHAADLAITKKLTSTEVIAGQPIAWEITVHNDGPSPATAVKVADTLPAGVSLTAMKPSQGTCAGSTCALGDLAAGESATISVTGTVDHGVPEAMLTNTATVSSDTPDADTSNNTVEVDTKPHAAADLSVSKTGPATATAGSTVSWAVRVTNAGPSDAHDVSLTDTLPAQVSSVTADGCEVNETTVRCSIDTMAPGSRDFTITGHVPSAYVGTLVNAVTVGSGTADANAGNNSATASTTVSAAADLSLTKTGPAATQAGSAITWTLVAANAGPSDAPAAVLTDTLPDGLQDVVLPDSCSRTGQHIKCPLGTIEVGKKASIELSATVDPTFTGTLANSASVTSSAADPSDANNSAAASTTVSAAADLSLTATDPESVVAGEEATWTLDIRNDGPSSSADTVLTYTLPDGVTFVTSSQPGCTVSGQTVTCQLGQMTPGGMAHVEITGLVAPATTGTVKTSASVASTTPDPVMGNNAAETSNPVATGADIWVSKDLATAHPVAGSPVSYTIKVGNHGPSVAREVVLTDPLPVALTKVQPPDGCKITDGTLTCAFNDIAPEATRELTVSGTLTASLTGTLSNTANVTSTTDDPGPSGNSATAEFNAETSADLAVTQTGPETVTAGQPVSWTVEVRNNGPSVARNVVISDFVDADITGVTITAPDGVSCSERMCTIAELADGAKITLTVAGTVTSGSTKDSVTHRVEVNSESPDPVSSNNSSLAEPPVQQHADVSITKTVTPEELTPGLDGSYRLTAHNDGPSDATGVLITDELPDGITLDNVPGCTQAARTLSCLIDDLASGQDAVLTVNFNLDAGFTGAQLSNTAKVTAGTPDPNPDNASATATASVAGKADLTISKVGPESVIAGQPVAWTIEVRNAGPSAAQNVVIHDQLPDGLTELLAQTSQGECAITGTELSCTVGTLAVGDTARIQIDVGGTVDPSYLGTALSNTATVTSDNPEPNGSDDGRRSDSVVTVDRQVDLVATKTADVTSAKTGSTVTWTLTVRNDGSSTAREVVLVDTLPAGITQPTSDSAVCQGVTCTAKVGELRPGASATITVSATVTATHGELVNTMTASSDITDMRPADNSASVTVKVEPTEPTTGPTVSTGPSVSSGPAEPSGPTEPSGPSGPGEPGPGRPLPATGFEVAPWLWAGLALLIVGAGLVGGPGRRQQARH